jgi:hypothetical protein
LNSSANAALGNAKTAKPRAASIPFRIVFMTFPFASTAPLTPWTTVMACSARRCCDAGHKNAVCAGELPRPGVTLQPLWEEHRNV